MPYEINILYYINFFKKYRKIILISVCTTMFLTFCYRFFFTPDVYASSITLLPVSGSSISSPSSGLGQLLGISQIGTSTWGGAIPILKSRRMARDIREHFKLNENPKFWYTISTKSLDFGCVEVRGPDPALIQQIANFCIENLDKINMELDYTVTKPMVKVLDPADYGTPEPKQILRPVIISGLLTFFLCVLFLFFRDYINALKVSQ